MFTFCLGHNNPKILSQPWNRYTVSLESGVNPKWRESVVVPEHLSHIQIPVSLDKFNEMLRSGEHQSAEGSGNWVCVG